MEGRVILISKQLTINLISMLMLTIINLISKQLIINLISMLLTTLLTIQLLLLVVDHPTAIILFSQLDAFH